MSEIRVGVVGVGHLGRHHARILGGMQGARLVGVADSRADQANAVAGSLGVPAFTSYTELLDKVDAVSIAVPTTAHRQVAGAFLERGIATLVEKPLALSVAESAELVALAEKTGAVLQVGHIERFNPTFDRLKQIAIRPRYIATERLSGYTFRSTDIGVVLDLMIHDIDLVLALVDSPVKSVSAVGTSVFGGAEDVASARVWFEDGTIADLSASRASLHATRKMRLWGREGYVGVDFKTRQLLHVKPSEALKQGNLMLEQLDMTQPDSIKDHVFGKVLEVEQSEVEGREQLCAELEDFLRAVRTNGTPTVTGHDGLRNMRLAEQIVHGIQEHVWEPDTSSNSAIPAPHIHLAARHPAATRP